MARSSGCKGGEEGTSIMVESIVESIAGLECVWIGVRVIDLVWEKNYLIIIKF